MRVGGNTVYDANDAALSALLRTIFELHSGQASL